MKKSNKKTKKQTCTLCGETSNSCKCIKSNKKQKNKIIKAFFCPKCKSTSIRFIFGFKNLMGLLPRQKCMSCGLEAAGFPQLVVDKKKLDKLNKRKKGKKK